MATMKFMCKCIPNWPSILTKLKQLCGFFRVKSWRKVMIYRAAELFEGIAKLLKSFTAKHIKWGYETMFECFWQLDQLRTFCQEVLAHHLREWFPNFKDGELLNSLWENLNDNELWTFIHVFNVKLFTPLEKARRWGLVCICHELERQLALKKRFCCVFNSRRLHQARKYVIALVDVLAADGRRVQLTFAEDVQWVAEAHSLCSRKVSMDLGYKTSYLKNVPWLVSEAEDPEIALECAAQLRNGNKANYTSLELYYFDNFLPDLDAPLVFED